MRAAARRLVIVLILASLATLPVGAAAGSPWAAAVPAAGAPKVAALGSLGSLWSWMIHRIWPDAGCGIDPSGGCATAAPGVKRAAGAGHARPEGGCLIDPNGECAAAVRPRVTVGAKRLRPDGGCGIDPNGGCAVAARRPR